MLLSCSNTIKPKRLPSLVVNNIFKSLSSSSPQHTLSIACGWTEGQQNVREVRRVGRDDDGDDGDEDDDDNDDNDDDDDDARTNLHRYG